jgi:ATP-dependent DNA helicase RecG
METSQGPLDDVVARLRAAATDLALIEVKAAAGGLPKDVWPTVSAFSNGDGGIVILGLDESRGFAPVDGFDAGAIRDALSDGFRPRKSGESAGPVTPQPIGSIDISTVDDAPVVVVDVEPLPPSRKPAFVTAQGKEAGTYERVGDGDRRMSTYGVFLLSTDGEQPRVDATAVQGATIEDLDASQIERYISRLRRRRPRSVADLSSTVDILRRHNVLADDATSATLAGLLAFGRYPQHFLPQAMVTFAVYPGRTKDAYAGETRMLDRRVIEGPIPAMVEDAVRAVLQNIQVRRVVAGAGARDEPEIPAIAIREAVTNALTHRDYSQWSLGDQVRVELYPDRLEVSNPGGIWGGRRVIDLFDGVSRSRNAVLSAMLADVPMLDADEAVAENAGSGIPAMTGALGRAGLAAPRYLARVTDVTVVLDRHGLLNPETDEWLA